MESKQAQKLSLQKRYEYLKDKKLLVDAYIEQYGFVRHHIESFNYFIEVKLKDIIRSQMNKEIKLSSDVDFLLEYKKIRVGMPEYPDKQPLLPSDCRLSNSTYSANVYVDVQVNFNGMNEYIQDINIGKIPILIGSSHCYMNYENKKTNQYYQLNECPYDPMGYFIVKGVEKVFIIQEQLSDNRILVEQDHKSKDIIAVVRSNTVDTKSVSTLIYKNGKFYLVCSSFSKPLPIFILFKAYGIESEQEVFQLITSNEHMINQLALSLEDIEENEVYNQEQAFEYFSKRIRQKNYGLKSLNIPQKAPIDEARDIITNIIFCHIPCKNFNYYPRALFLAICVRRLLEAMSNPEKIDKRDNFCHKRMKCAGRFLELLFEDKFKLLNSFIKKDLAREITKHKNKIYSIKNRIVSTIEKHSDLITSAFVHAISTGNWIIKRFHLDSQGATQVLSRLSYISALGMVTRMNSVFSKTLKMTGPRALLGSHWGMVCPSDSPDGESCGLTKNLSLLAHISVEKSQKTLQHIAIQLGMEDIGHYSSGEIYEPQNFMVLLNSQPIGITQYPRQLVNDLRTLRRRGKIGDSVSIYINQDRKTANIDTDDGRICRPYIVVDDLIPALQSVHIEQLKNKQKTFKDFVNEGIVEYLDVNEEDDSLIALNVEDIQPQTTHLEIDPMTLLGVVAGIIPYPHHNQASRNTFQCAMGKQALGVIGESCMTRTDNLQYLLLYPQTPLLKTKSIELTGYNKFPAGHNASLAVVSYSGYDIEDASIMNKASLDRGFGRTLVYRRHETEIKKFKEGIQEMRVKPPEIDEKSENFTRNRFHGISEEDGIINVGATIKNGDILVNKMTPIIPPSLRNQIIPKEKLAWNSTPSIFKAKSQGLQKIDKVLAVTNDEGNTIIKTMIRELRRPEIGDKFSSRHGQKGVIGLIANQEDMPFSEQGWCPDLIMNPHGYPSRMTVGKLLELIGSKAAVMDGRFRDGSAFAGDKLEDLSRALVENGFSYSGKDVLISGITGEYMYCYVYCGPVFYQRLKHMVADKVHARSRGKIATLTRQPTEGRARDGGLRLGEMERDCLLSYGASSLIVERLMISSDLFTIWVCEKCGFIKSEGYCKLCKTNNVYQIDIPYACKLMFQELVSMNIKPKLNLADTVNLK